MSRFLLIDALLALRKVFLSPRQSQRIYSQFGEDAVLLQMVGRKTRDGFYVDVGCHHPRKGSNTYLFYRLGWRGVLIDIERSKLLACRILRPGDETVLAAASDREEDVKIYAAKEFSVLATIDEIYANGAPVIGRIRTRLLTDILDGTRFKGRRIDLLSVDVEGSDIKVLRGLDFARYSPRMIMVESLDRKIDRVLAGETHRFLIEKGYELAAWAGLSLIYKIRL